MPDDSRHLERTLSELHQQLETSKSVDPQTRELLKQLMQDIDRVLLTSGDDPRIEISRETEESLVGRLADTARHFEETHPNLSGAVGSVIDALSRMGI